MEKWNTETRKRGNMQEGHGKVEKVKSGRGKWKSGKVEK